MTQQVIVTVENSSLNDQLNVIRLERLFTKYELDYMKIHMSKSIEYVYTCHDLSDEGVQHFKKFLSMLVELVYPVPHRDKSSYDRSAPRTGIKDRELVIETVQGGKLNDDKVRQLFRILTNGE